MKTRQGAGALVFLIATALATFAEDPVVVKSQPAASTTGSAPPSTLSLRVFSGKEEFKGLAGGAQVWIDRRLAGLAPLAKYPVEAGSRLIDVRVEGYREREFVLSVERGTDYELTVTLEKALGYIRVEVSPPDAEILLDGRSQYSRLIEAQAGIRELRARRFGYREASSQVLVFDRLVTQVRLVLDPAPFEVARFASSRERFNPANAGPFGSLRLSFEVSSWGSAELVILDPDGRRVFEETWRGFDTWEQGLLWRGLDSAGSVLPDGAYEVRLAARGQGPGGLRDEGSAVERSLTVIIDSTAVARPRGSQEGLVGLAWLPDPSPQPEGLGMVDVVAGWDASLDLPFVSMSGGFSAGSFAVGFLADAALPSDMRAQARFGLGFVVPLPGDGDFESGLGFKALATITESVTPGFAGAIQLPLVLAKGGARAGTVQTRLGLSPGLGLAWKPGEGVPDLEAQLGAGVSLGTSGWLLGLSARSAVSGLQVLAPAWTGIVGSLEGRSLLGDGPLILSASITATVDARGAAALVRGGIGLGLWF